MTFKLDIGDRDPRSDEDALAIFHAEHRRFFLAFLKDLRDQAPNLERAFTTVIEAERRLCEADIERKQALLSRSEKLLEQGLAKHQEMRAEIDSKTSDLRRLRDEIDPNVTARRIASAVDAATTSAAIEISQLKSEREALRSEVRDLQASKRKLRDALERAKAAR